MNCCYISILYVFEAEIISLIDNKWNKNASCLFLLCLLCIYIFSTSDWVKLMIIELRMTSVSVKFPKRNMTSQFPDDLDDFLNI